MPTWHPEPASGYTPVPSAYIPPGAALQRRPSGSSARFPPSAAAERSEPSELHDRWTFSAPQTALCPASDPEWQDAHPEFPRIVFHGLRHSSAHLSADDLWRRCEGRSGHHRTRYGGYAGEHLCAHIQKSSRVELGKKFEEGFYAKRESPSPQAVPAADEPTISTTALLELLKNADPEIKAQLRLALLT